MVQQIGDDDVFVTSSSRQRSAAFNVGVSELSSLADGLTNGGPGNQSPLQGARNPNCLKLLSKFISF